MTELIPTKQFTDRLEGIREEKRALEEEEGHLLYVIEHFTKSNKPKNTRLALRLRNSQRDCGGPEKRRSVGFPLPKICALFLSGGWQSTSSKPLRVVVSTLNGEIRIKKDERGTATYH